MSSAFATALTLTVEEYEAMIENGAFAGLQRKIELFRGELVQMSPAGFVHDDLIAYLTRWSIHSTRGMGILVRIQSGLSMPQLSSRLEPDILWVRDRRYLDRHPRSEDVLLVIEVSDSSIKYDRIDKALLYSEAGIAEFWVVDVAEQAVIIHRNPRSGGYAEVKLHPSKETVASLACPSSELRLSELFAT